MRKKYFNPNSFISIRFINAPGAFPLTQPSQASQVSQLIPLSPLIPCFKIPAQAGFSTTIGAAL